MWFGSGESRSILCAGKMYISGETSPIQPWRREQKGARDEQVSLHEWERRKPQHGDLAEFFANSPLRDADVEIERARDYSDELEL